jgi:hypothetical protein
MLLCTGKRFALFLSLIDSLTPLSTVMKLFSKKLRAILIASPLVFSAQSAMAQAEPDATFEDGCSGQAVPAVSGTLSAFEAFLKGKPAGCQLGDKIYSAFDWSSTFDHENTFIRIGQSGPGFKTHALNVSNVNGIDLSSAFFNYTVSVDPISPLFINKWRASAEPSGFDPGYTLATNGVSSVFSYPAPGGPTLNIANVTTLAFANTLTVDPGKDGPISFTNTIAQTEATVPGPLPLLGAGAAFGFSRKLRVRIKTAA